MKTKVTKEGWHIIEGDSHVGKWIEDSGRLDHDQHLIPLIESMLQIGMVVIDAGALYGDHSLAYARAVSSSGAVIAIEPNPMAFECLSKNAERFQSPMFLMNLALCDHANSGGKAIHVMEDMNIGASQVKKDKSNDSKIEKEITTASLDAIVEGANLERLDFAKLDIEGYEYEALKGFRRSIVKFRPGLVIEMNSFALSQQGSCYKDIYDFLLSVNYSWRIIQPEAGGGSPQYDVFAWPNLIETPKLVKVEKIVNEP